MVDTSDNLSMHRNADEVLHRSDTTRHRDSQLFKRASGIPLVVVPFKTAEKSPEGSLLKALSLDGLGVIVRGSCVGFRGDGAGTPCRSGGLALWGFTGWGLGADHGCAATPFAVAIASRQLSQAIKAIRAQH